MTHRTPVLESDGEPHYVTSCAFLPIVNPKGGKRIDIYGAGKPVPKGALTAEQVRHLLDKGMIEVSDGKGNVDHGRVIECLTAIIACCADDEGSETWGRPRIAERLRANGFTYGNDTLSKAVKLWKSGPAE